MAAGLIDRAGGSARTVKQLNDANIAKMPRVTGGSAGST